MQKLKFANNSSSEIVTMQFCHALSQLKKKKIKTKKNCKKKNICQQIWIMTQAFSKQQNAVHWAVDI